VPAGKEDVVMCNAGALIVIERDAVTEAEAPSVTLTVKVDDPAAVGVPAIVVPWRFRPAGRGPVAKDHV
jgi:hypothetical protein